MTNTRKTEPPYTLAGLRAECHHFLLRATAEQLLYDWIAAAEVMRQAWAIVERRWPEISTAEAGVQRGCICGHRTRLVVAYKKAKGLCPPRAERAKLAERINTLPPTLREAMHAWLALDLGENLTDPAKAVRARIGLTLLGRRKVAA